MNKTWTSADLVNHIISLGFDPKDEAFLYAYNHDAMFHRAIREGVSLQDLCLLLSSAKREQAYRTNEMIAQQPILIPQCPHCIKEE